MSQPHDLRLATLTALGVPIDVLATAGLAGLFGRSDQPARTRISAMGPVDGVSGFTRAAVELSDMLSFHACSVSSEAGAVVVPGVSGLGKSTLAAALTMAGFGYLSDEVFAVDRSTLEYASFPRPITVDERSCRALGLPDVVPVGAEETAIDPRRLGTVGPARGRLSTIVLARRGTQPGVAPRIAEAGSAAAVTAMLQACFNHYRWPREAVEITATLVAGARLVELEYTEAREAARYLVEVVADAQRSPLA